MFHEEDLGVTQDTMTLAYNAGKLGIVVHLEPPFALLNLMNHSHEIMAKRCRQTYLVPLTGNIT